MCFHKFLACAIEPNLLFKAAKLPNFAPSWPETRFFALPKKLNLKNKVSYKHFLGLFSVLCLRFGQVQNCPNLFGKKQIPSEPSA